MTRARELANLAGVSETALSNRNLIINGAMQVAQRGTSQTTSGYGSVDRWFIDSTADGGGQVADAPDGFEYSLKINPDAGNGTLRQAIELLAAGKGGVFRSGETFTLSFWLKSDNAEEAINIFIASSTSVDGTTTNHVDDTSTGLTTSTAWTKYTYTYTQSSDVGGSDTCYNIVPYVSTPSGAVYFTGVQLEVGEQATPFEHRSYADELAACQRYFYKTQADSAFDFFGLGTVILTTLAYQTINYPVTMRSTPALSTSGNLRNYRNGGSAITGTAINHASRYFMVIEATSSGGGLTVGDAALIGANNDADAAILLDAEL